jgi:hypothetical protein
MSYSSLTNYVKYGWPRKRTDTASRGTEYAYVGPYSTLSSNLPKPQDIWADGLPVSATSLEYITRTDVLQPWGELIVNTSISSASIADTGPTLDESIYELQWVQEDLELRFHPEFLPGGTYALDVDDLAAFYAWDAEINLDLKKYGFYYLRDSDGVIYGDLQDLSYNSPNANVLAYYVWYGILTYPNFIPIWTKQSTYYGSYPPSAASIGQKENPSGSGYPSGFEWRKNDDRVSRVGRRAEWKRYESWIGAKKVWVDRDELF